MLLEKIAAAAEKEESDRNVDVYDIGKRFMYWETQRQNKNYIEAKYRDVKEELFESPVLAGLMTRRGWDQLTETVQVRINTKSAKLRQSNGQVCYLMK